MEGVTPTDPELSRGLTAVTQAAIKIRPSISRASASSRSLPKSTHPRISIFVLSRAVPSSIRKGVEEICKHAVRKNVQIIHTDSVPKSRRSSYIWVVGFEERTDIPSGSLKISCSHDDFTKVPEDQDFAIQVTYNRPIEAFRGLGHVLAISRGLSSFQHPDVPQSGDLDGEAENGAFAEDGSAKLSWSGNVGEDLRREEQCLFENVGVMIDCSRNGVMNVTWVKQLLRHTSLMGINFLQLYCEDTYQIPGEPFFGYFRGPYTEAELKEIDDYAFELGIEVIACIQTLGHLGQMLQWPRYGPLRDTSEVLIAEHPDTYAFIEKMIAAVSKPLRSKRIHIGMDEAHGVSEGRYRQMFGYKESTKVFVEHLRKVGDICKRAGLNPMIWSDMLFCLPAKNNSLGGYYDVNSVVTEELADSIPAEIDTVFWDYYHVDSRPYTAKIAQHWQLASKAPWMASGVWTWSRFWTALPFTFATVRASMVASKAANTGVKNVMTTIWGDEGNECDLYSALPGMLYKAEHAYTSADEVDGTLLRRKFDGIVGGDLDDYVYASKLDDTQPEAQPIDIKTHYTPNLAKFLLWEEPFFSFLSPQYRGFDMESHYSHLAAYLEQAISSDFSVMNTVGVPHSIEDFPANERLRLPYLLAKILSLKCHLRERLAYAYKTGDRAELLALAGPDPESRMSRLRDLVRQLHALHRKNWMGMYKPFGFEILDLRYGGLKARLETMHLRLAAYLDMQDTSVDRIEELEVELQTIYPGQGANLLLDYSRASRATYI